MILEPEGGKAYMTPDIIIRGPERWVLIRLKANAWTSGPDDPSELELSGMVMWAVLQHTLPEGEDNYEIALLSHVEKSGWRTWRRPVRRGETRMLSDMIRSDLKESRLLVHKAGPLLDLSRIPLAEKKTRCRDCGYRYTCPGGKDMLLAKLQQHAAEMVGTSE